MPAPDAALHLVATPIGNLRDVTLRALDVLAGASVIACEDTRTTARLLQRYGIDTPRTAYNEHNADERGPALLDRVANGEAVALVSDAGMPLVSDPGARLVAQAVERGLPVVPLPGATAPVAALAASGLAGDAGFVFLGFLPAREGARRDVLDGVAGTRRTLVAFESPHRLVASLKSMVDALGGRRACVSREITKLHETHHRGRLGELVVEFAAKARVRGEIVVTVEGRVEETQPRSDDDVEALLAGLLAEQPAGRAAAEAARLTGRSKRDLYQLALRLKGRG